MKEVVVVEILGHLPPEEYLDRSGNERDNHSENDRESKPQCHHPDDLQNEYDQHKRDIEQDYVDKLILDKSNPVGIEESR